MPETRVFEGKTTNEAIEKGLKELKVSKNDVEINVIKEENKRSFFDILAPRVVKVEMKIKEKVPVKTEKEKNAETIEIDKSVMENAKKKVTEFLEDFLFKTTGKKIDYTCNVKENTIEIIINDENAEFLIGYRGETLNALQVILTNIAVKNSKERIRIEIDILGYREKRRKVLEDLAEKISKTVIRTGKSIALEPMIPYERKIIHTKLQNNNKVKTVSVGEGMHRKVIISLK